MNCCNEFGICKQGFGCPGRESTLETRGQTNAAERAWGEMPIQFVGEEPEEVKDVPPHSEVIKSFLTGFALAMAGVILGVCAGTAIYLKFNF